MKRKLEFLKKKLQTNSDYSFESDHYLTLKEAEDTTKDKDKDKDTMYPINYEEDEENQKKPEFSDAYFSEFLTFMSD